MLDLGCYRQHSSAATPQSSWHPETSVSWPTSIYLPGNAVKTFTLVDSQLVAEPPRVGLEVEPLNEGVVYIERLLLVSIVFSELLIYDLMQAVIGI